MQKQRDAALVPCLSGVGMQPLVQFGIRRENAKHQHQRHSGSGEQPVQE